MRDFQSPPPVTEPAAPPDRSLFRQQAVEHVTTKQYGTVILARPFSHLALTALFVGIAVAIVGFFILFGTTRKEQSQGILVPTAGVIRIMAGQAGVITQVKAKEGALVRAGDVLFVLSGERSSASSDSTQKTISALLQRRRDSFDAELDQSGLQSRQRLAAAQRRARELAADVERLGEQIALQQDRVSLAEQSLKRYGELRATNYISPAQFQDKQAELLDQRQRLADLRRAQSAVRRELAGADADINDMKVRAQRESAALQRNVAEIEQDLAENEARREIVVRAAQDGMLAAVMTEVGQTVGPSTVLASVLPAGAVLEAEVYAPSRSAGFIKPGMKVSLRYPAYPYQKFGQYTAYVRAIAYTSLSPQELGVPGVVGGAGEPLYRIRLKLDRQEVQAYGRAMPLKSGMLVDASIELEQRRLYEWVLEPLYSISGRM